MIPLRKTDARAPDDLSWAPPLIVGLGLGVLLLFLVLTG